MHYGQIIAQAWQIIKRTKLLWLFGLLNFLSGFIHFRRMETTGLACLSVIISCTSLLLDLFSMFGFITCTDTAIQGHPSSFRETWDSFQSKPGRVVLLVLTIVFAIAICYFFGAILVGLINLAAKNALADARLRVFLTFLITSSFYNIIITYAYFGLTTHRQKVCREHGREILGKNFWKLFALDLIIRMPYFLSLVILWAALLITKGSISYSIFLQYQSLFPMYISLGLISNFTSLLAIAAFTVVFNQACKEFDTTPSETEPSRDIVEGQQS